MENNTELDNQMTAQDQNIQSDIFSNFDIDPKFYNSYDKDGLLVTNEKSVDARWYACQVNVNNEDAAKKILDQKIANLGFEEKILEVYVPAKKVIKLNKKGEREEKLEKVHPGYIYINAILTREVAFVIQQSNMITRMPIIGGVYSPLDAGYIENIKLKIKEESKKDSIVAVNNLKLNDTIVVTDGPFNDMQGKICSINSEGTRIGVLLSIFDRETVVELDILEIKKV